MPKTRSKSFLDVLRQRELVGDASFENKLDITFKYSVLRRAEITEFCVANDMIEMCDDVTINLVCIDSCPSSDGFSSVSEHDSNDSESDTSVYADGYVGIGRNVGYASDVDSE